MKILLMTAALSLTLTAGPVFAESSQEQQPPQSPPAQEPPTGQQPAPEPPQQPGVPPASEAPPPPRPTQPPRPFPEGAKVAYVDTQAVVSQSAEGKAAQVQIQTFAEKKNGELEPRQKALQEAEQKLEQESSVMNEAARAQLQKDVERRRVDLQRAQQDAQRELQELNGEIQQKFVQKLLPVIGKVAQEKGLHFVLSLTPDVLFADSGLDITQDVVKALDAANEGTNTPEKK